MLGWLVDGGFYYCIPWISHEYPITIPLLYVWVNYNISLTWIVRPFGDDFPIKTMIPGFGRTGFGRYKLPKHSYLKWWFSIAMLVYQRVSSYYHHTIDPLWIHPWFIARNIIKLRGFSSKPCVISSKLISDGKSPLITADNHWLSLLTTRKTIGKPWGGSFDPIDIDIDIDI